MATGGWRSAIATALIGAAAALASAQNPPAMENGRRLFEGQCARCHGFGGAGGEGPPLNQPNLQRGTDEKELIATIRNGIPSQGMPGARMTDREIAQVAAYVRAIGRRAPGPVPGNPQRGMALYQSGGCAGCHIVRGAGGGLGPELSEIGSRRAPEHLRQSLVDPGASLPRPRRFLDYLVVRVVAADGAEVRGIRANEDTLTIQLRDSAGRLHSFRKPDLRSIEKQTGQSLMPSYRSSMSEAELTDLVAYLASLRGQP